MAALGEAQADPRLFSKAASLIVTCAFSSLKWGTKGAYLRLSPVVDIRKRLGIVNCSAV